MYLKRSSYFLTVPNSGISSNGSGFTRNNPPAPEGSQVAILQTTGSFYQSVDGWAAGSYQISFMAAQRSGYPNQDFDVLVDGTSVYHCTPGSTAYGQYTTATFTVTAGADTIKFRGDDSGGGDRTAFIDAISIVPV